MPDYVKYKDFKRMLHYSFKSYCVSMLLFKSDINWDYVNKIQLWIFIYTCMIAEFERIMLSQKTKQNKNIHKIVSKKEERKRRKPHFILGHIMCQVYWLTIFFLVIIQFMFTVNIKAKYHLFFLKKRKQNFQDIQ